MVIDVPLTLFFILGCALTLLLLLVCAAIGKWLFAGRSTGNKQETEYLLKVDENGHMRIKRYRSRTKVGSVTSWGDSKEI